MLYKALSNVSRVTFILLQGLAEYTAFSRHSNVTWYTIYYTAEKFRGINIFANAVISAMQSLTQEKIFIESRW